MLRRMLTPLLVVSFGAALPVAAAGRSDSPVVPSARAGLSDQVVGVETRPSPGGLIVRDTFGGALIGAAIGGGVAACRRYCSSNGTWGNWGRDVGIGAAIGAGVGLIFGVVDASSNSDTVMRGPVADERATGFAPAPASYGGRF